jgi:hypothetical protein
MIRSLLLLTACYLTFPAHAGPSSFDFMLGNWTSETVWMQADTSTTRAAGRHHFYRAFGGQGLIDDNLQSTEDNFRYTGTTIRTWDPAESHWVCHWYDGNARKWGPAFHLRAEGQLIRGEAPRTDAHGSFVDTITFELLDRDAVSWRMVRKYKTLDTPLTIGTIDYRRVK